MYATEADWRELVLNRMRSASLVVIGAGAGPGLAWEVREAFSTLLKPEQLVVLVLNLTLDEYRVFADQVRAQAGLTLPTLNRAVLSGRSSTFAIT
jgi:hypothetical protein